MCSWVAGYAGIPEKWPNPPSQNFRMEESKHIGETWMDVCLGRPGWRRKFTQNYRLFGQTSNLLSKPRALPRFLHSQGRSGCVSVLA